MSAFAEVRHEEWIAAPEVLVRSQFADLEHHIATGVHPKLRFRVLESTPELTRFEQEVKLLGLRQRDVFERRFTPEGEMVDLSVEGFNRGGSLRFAFQPELRGGAPGTRVAITIRLPLPPLVGALVRLLLEHQVRREVAAAAAEDKYDLEVRGYRAPAMPATAPAVALAA